MCMLKIHKIHVEFNRFLIELTFSLHSPSLLTPLCPPRFPQEDSCELVALVMAVSVLMLLGFCCIRQCRSDLP